MQRHFSNRGEARAEVTAAKTLACRKPSTPPQFIARIGRQTKPPASVASEGRVDHGIDANP
jgi:hypothetical protein